MMFIVYIGREQNHTLNKNDLKRRQANFQPKYQRNQSPVSNIISQVYNHFLFLPLSILFTQSHPQ